MKSDHFREVTKKLMVLPLTREWIEMSAPATEYYCPRVLPLTREWIEITKKTKSEQIAIVLPLTREWIEILISSATLITS